MPAINLLKNLEKHQELKEPEFYIPSATPMFVSLFVIMLTFFIVLISNKDLKENNADMAMQSISKQFGNSEEEFMAISDTKKPKVSPHTVEIQKLLKDVATVQSSLNGDETTITFDKSAIFYLQETNLRADREFLVEQLVNNIKQWKSEENIRIQLIVGLEDYDMEKDRLKLFFNLFQPIPAEVGFSKDNQKFIFIKVKPNV